MNLLIHFDQAAQRADADGCPHFAAAIRGLLVREIERADTEQFMEWVLGLPHHIPASVAPYFDDNSYLKKLTALGCRQCDNDLGPAHACTPKRTNGVELVKERLAGKSLALFKLKHDPAYIWKTFGKLGNNLPPAVSHTPGPVPTCEQCGYPCKMFCKYCDACELLHK